MSLTLGNETKHQIIGLICPQMSPLLNEKNFSFFRPMEQSSISLKDHFSCLGPEIDKVERQI